MQRCLLIFLLCSAWLGAADPARQRLSDAKHWLCYYGNDRRALDVADVEVLVLDPDAMGALSPADKRGRICLAYVSCGEAEDSRWYWPEIAKAAWVLKPNPDWAGAHLVDLRSAAWRDLVVQQVARRALQAGYDGLMLDTLDTVDTLINADALTYEGIASAAVKLVRELRITYPSAVLMANGGMAIFSGTAPSLDAVMIEGLRGTFDFGEQRYRLRRDDELPHLSRLIQRIQSAHVPLFALEYIAPNAPLAERNALSDQVRRLGARPFVGQIGLNTVPGP